MTGDSKRFPDTAGWGYAQFNYDIVPATFTPMGSDGGKCVLASSQKSPTAGRMPGTGACAEVRERERILL